MDGRMWKLVACLVLLTGPSLQLVSAAELELTMPSVQPKENDTYLCHSQKVEDHLYVTGFRPKASMSVAHHILIYVCSEPGGSDEKWDCGEMHRTTAGEYQTGPVCKDGGKIIYAWAMDAPKLTLPKDVAFKIGGSADKQYLVMQVHYKDVTRFLPPYSDKDKSGVVLTTTTKPRSKTAGVYLIAANGYVRPHSVTYMEAACTFQEPMTLIPFAFRVHTHKLGKVVSGYIVRDGDWTEIGRRSPQKPQMFYSIQDKSLKISQGDTLAARCTMENDGDKTVETGPTSDDEMCNFYIMYSVKGNQEVQDPICMSPGPPEWNWNDFKGFDAGNAPTQASVDPETSDWFKESEQFLNGVQHNLRKQNDDMQSRFMEKLRQIMNNPAFPNSDYQNLFAPSQQVDEPHRNNNLPLAYDEEPVDYSYGDENDDQYQPYQQPEGPLNYVPVGYQEFPMEVKTHKISLNGLLGKPEISVENEPTDVEEAGEAKNIGRMSSSVETKIVGVSPVSSKSTKITFPKQPPKEPESEKEKTAPRVFESSNFPFPDMKMPDWQSFKVPAIPQIPTIPPLNLKFPAIPPIKMPDPPKMPEFTNPQEFAAGNNDPSSSESFQVFDDKNGGKGFKHQKSQSSFNTYNAPGASGYSNSYSQKSSSHYSKSYSV